MTQDKPTNGKRRIFIVEDHVMVREGFVALVDREKDLMVCGQSDRMSETLPLIRQTSPDLVVVDLILRDGDGLELVKTLRDQHPGLPILVVSMQDEEIYAERALHAGARGYLMKYCATSDLMVAIRKILGGDVYVSPKMNARILRDMIGTKPKEQAEDGLDRLSDRELEIFQLLGSGLGTREIAKRLGISAKTVETHREHIKDKLCLSNAIELVQAASHWVDSSSTRPEPREKLLPS